MIQQYPYHVCMQYLHRYVKVQTTDGKVFEGIIAHVDHDKVILAIPEGKEAPAHRAFIGPFGPGFGFFPGFRPFAFPFGALGGIFPFTFFI
ncbi:phosphatidylinositol kinase [Paenibacillus hamazuiensis]|uniref:phosphatidylinositol kinase n=1 Tax=Paenibacillus hamazuiensis TaxID=2936508 RepID=UPI00200F35A2|nr:phosphatidylinositol kinase [Paenibacillus hamazuiensis]